MPKTFAHKRIANGDGFMQIETAGNYQIHIIAHEDHAAGGWDAYITVMQWFRSRVRRREQ